MKAASISPLIARCFAAAALLTAAIATAQPDPSHWAFQPLSKTSPPSDPSGWSANTIDRFVHAEFQRRGATPNPPADPRTLVRRVTFDLIGLPPSPDEIEAFVNDPEPHAYQRLVDRLLQSPHYGERWGRHWLDVAGFAESSMFIGDVPRQGFWRYRDYVIRAFNSDKPYNRFVLEQLASDELFNWREADEFTPDQIDLLAATGFLRCAPDATDNQPITQMDKRYAAQQSAVEISMKALMGLTINCVRCHDHKFDPISQEEYYRLIAVFQPVYDPEQWLPGIYTKARPGPLRAIPILPGPERRRVLAASPNWPSEHLELAKAIRGGLDRHYRDRWLREHLPGIPNDQIRQRIAAALDEPSEQRSEADEALCKEQAQQLGFSPEQLKELFPEFERELADTKARNEELKEKNAAFDDVIWCAFDTTPTPTPTHLLQRGNYQSPAQTVEPGVIAVLNHSPNPIRFDQPPGVWTTGRRLALARWLTDRNHPLTARVMVNRIWQYHFGTGLVSTPDDFGARGSRPVSRDLLDWLAQEFMENGWSIKHVHRLILNSLTFRQAFDDETGAPNALRPGPRRLEAEVIRDAMLDVSGRLDKRLFGPSIPTERSEDGSFVIKKNHSERFRRSIYIHTRRTFIPTFLALFDQPTMDTNCPKRSHSAIPQQALALMNDPFVAERARDFAQSVLAEADSTFESRLQRAFLLAYGRPPAADEVDLFRPVASSHDNPWPIICHSLLSANEFLYVD